MHTVVQPQQNIYLSDRMSEFSQILLRRGYSYERVLQYERWVVLLLHFYRMRNPDHLSSDDIHHFFDYLREERGVPRENRYDAFLAIQLFFRGILRRRFLEITFR